LNSTHPTHNNSFMHEAHKSMNQLTSFKFAFNNNMMIELFLCNNGWREICNSVTWFYSFSFLCNNSIELNWIPFHSISLSLSLSLSLSGCDWLLLRNFNFQLQFKKITQLWTWDRSSIITHF
jgi:hypothetical protein